MSVIDPELKEYLDLKFSQVIESLKKDTDKNTNDISHTTKRVDEIELRHKIHIEDHKNGIDRNRFNLTNLLVVIGIFLSATITWIKG